MSKIADEQRAGGAKRNGPRVTVSQGRRDFLTLAALGAPAAVVAAAAGRPQPPTPFRARTPPDTVNQSRKKYLDTARF